MIHPSIVVRRRPLVAGAVAIVLVVSLLAGCTGDRDAAVKAGVDQVTFITGFGVFGREAGVYAAQAHGWFAEQDIEVQIEPGTGAADNTAKVVGGRAQFALTDLTGAVVLAGTGEATTFRAVAALHQLAPIGIFALAGSGIDNPRDLEGRTVADSGASVGRLLWPAYVDLAGIDGSRVELVDALPPRLPTLLATETVDAIGQYAFGQPTLETAAGGREVVFLPYSDFLTDLYGIALITSVDLIEGNPDLVRRFTTALLAGVEYAVTHPEQAGRILADAVADGDTPTAQVAAAELQLMRPYVIQAGVPIGNIDSVRVSQTIALIEATGGIPAGFTAEEVVAGDLVTNR